MGGTTCGGGKAATIRRHVAAVRMHKATILPCNRFMEPSLSVRLCVADEHGQLDAVETATKTISCSSAIPSTWPWKADSWLLAFRSCSRPSYSDWQSEDVPGPGAVSCREIQAAFGTMTPDPPDAHWRRGCDDPDDDLQRWRRSTSTSNGEPLLERLIALTQTARKPGLADRWGDPMSEVSPSLRDSLDAIRHEPARRMAREASDPTCRSAPATVPSRLVTLRARAGGLRPPGPRQMPWRSARDEQPATSECACAVHGMPAAGQSHDSVAAAPGRRSEWRLPTARIIDFETRSCLIAALPDARDCVDAPAKQGPTRTSQARGVRTGRPKRGSLAHARGGASRSCKRLLRRLRRRDARP